jgi:hypothetical protein
MESGVVRVAATQAVPTILDLSYVSRRPSGLSGMQRPRVRIWLCCRSASSRYVLTGQFRTPLPDGAPEEEVAR